MPFASCNMEQTAIISILSLGIESASIEHKWDHVNEL